MSTATDHDERVGAWTTFRDMPGAARLLLVGVFVNQFGAFLQAFLVLYLTHRDFTESQALYGMGAYGAGAVVGLLFGGEMSDRLGPRRTIIVSMSASAVLPITVTLAGNYALIVVVVAAAGAMAQLYRPAAAAILADLVPEARQTMAFAMNRLALNLGLVLGPLLAGLLINHDQWNLLFWIDGVSAALYVGIALFFLPRTARDEPGSEPATGKYVSVLDDRRYLLFILGVLANALVYIQTYSVLPLTMKDRGFADHDFGVLLTVGATVLITCELFVTRFTQRWPPRRAAAIGLVLLAIGLTAYALPVHALALFFIGNAIGVIGQIIGAPAIFSYPAKVAPRGLTGRYMGAFFAMFGLGQALGPVIAAPIYHQLGSNTWYFSGAIGLLAAVLAYAGMTGARDREVEPVTGAVGGPEGADLDAMQAEREAAQDEPNAAAVETGSAGPADPAPASTAREQREAIR